MEQTNFQSIPTEQPLQISWFSKYRWPVSISICVALVIAGLLYAYFKPKAIDPRTITNVNGDLGKNGRDIGYNWDSLPPGVVPGDTIAIKFSRGGATFKSSCVFTKYFADDIYYCQAPWPEQAMPVETDLNKYTFTAVHRWDSLWNKFSNTIQRPVVLKINDIPLTDAQVGEPYSAIISFSYTGTSVLKATLIGLPPGIKPDVEFTVRAQNGKGQVVLSGIPTVKGSYVGFLTILDQQNNSKDVRQLQINVGAPQGSLKLTAPLPAPVGTAGEDYTVSFQASGGKPPYTFSYVDAWNRFKFCSAFIMKPDGVLTSVGATEKPVVGSCSLSVTVKDALGNTQELLYGFDIK